MYDVLNEHLADDEPRPKDLIDDFDSHFDLGLED